jgi:hypothetical protein
VTSNACMPTPPLKHALQYFQFNINEKPAQ